MVIGHLVNDLRDVEDGEDVPVEVDLASRIRADEA
jgi:hypothetical protein